MGSADQEELSRWLALLRAPAGPTTLGPLLEQCGSASALFAEPPAGLSGPLRDYLRRPDWDAVARDLEWARSDDRHVIPLNDPRYPPLLRGLRGAPLVLFVTGEPRVLSLPQLAMVGSRNPTSAGGETAYEFARHLAGAGLVITSGLALGVDAASHRGALEGGGQTIAVGGTGPDRVYPARHRDLAHAIVTAGGALVTEFPPGTQALPAHFPQRNRIISGLALGTLVVEAALRSGSLITARLAVEQGREVFAIPGSIHNPLARGCHRLIRDGAKLVETAADILEELAPQLHACLAESSLPEEESFGPLELDQDYRRLLECLDYGPTAVDLLVERSGLTAEAVSSILLVLELQGYVSSAPGGHYARTSKRV